MKTRPNLLQGSISKNILLLAAPIVFVMFLQTLFNVVDTIFVGRISAYAVAAVSMAFPVIFIIIAIGAGLGIGTTSLIARHLGAKKKHEADLAAEHSIFIGIFISILITVLGLAFMKPLFVLMGAGPEILPLVLSYARIIFAAMIFLVMGMVGNAILQGEGDTKTPMKIMSFAVVLNIILDPIFIFTLGYGIAGAAMATALSRSIGFILIWYFLLSNRAMIQFDLKSFRYNPKIPKSILSVGFPSMLQHAIMGVAMGVIMKIVSLFGPLAIAAYGIGFRLESMAILPALGLGMAIVTIVGQNMGAGQASRAKKSTWAAAGMAAAFAIALGILFLALPFQTITLFNSDPTVIGYGVSFIRIVSLTFLFTTTSIIIMHAFQGAGNGTIPLLLTFLRLFIFSVPLAYFLSITLGYGVNGIWIGLSASNLFAGIISMVWFKLSKLGPGKS